MNTRIDHFMYAVPDLDDGMRWATDTFGAEPIYGGEHVGLGTRNALLSLGSTYLEIIAPDPAQDLQGTLGQSFAELSEGGLVTWAAEGNLAHIAHTLKRQGIRSSGPNRTERQTADGSLMIWELLFPIGVSEGSRMPFFIDWLDCENPKDTAPPGGAFESLVISTPEPQRLAAIFDDLGLSVDVVEGKPNLAASIKTGSASIVIESSEETKRLGLTR